MEVPPEESRLIIFLPNRVVLGGQLLSLYVVLLRK